MIALLAYGIVGGLHLLGAAIPSDVLQWLTKPLLMPLLAGYAVLEWRRRGVAASRLLLGALALAWAGDVVLEFPGTGALIVGMLFFLGAYAGYAIGFIRAGAVPRLRRWPLAAVPFGYAVSVGSALAWLWPGLSEAGLAVPMACYAAVLAAMATLAATQGWRIGVGGGLLLLSDTLIGMRLADAGTLPGPPIWVMTTYLLGQALVGTGWVAHASAAGSGRKRKSVAAPALVARASADGQTVGDR